MTLSEFYTYMQVHIILYPYNQQHPMV